MGTRHWPEDADDEVERLEGVIKHFRAEVARMKEELADTRRPYEELRKLIDGGSESMTHEDAVRELELMVSQQQSEPVGEFWEWLPKAYRGTECNDNPIFTKWNMEVAFLAGRQSSPPAQSESERDAVLRLAKDALESCTPGDYSTSHVIYPSFDERLVSDALAAIAAMQEGK